MTLSLRPEGLEDPSRLVLEPRSREESMRVAGSAVGGKSGWDAQGASGGS